MSFTVLCVVATVVSSIDSLGEQCVNCRTKKRSSIPLWNKHDIVVSFNSENGTEVAKLSRDFHSISQEAR